MGVGKGRERRRGVACRVRLEASEGEGSLGMASRCGVLGRGESE